VPTAASKETLTLHEAVVDLREDWRLGMRFMISGRLTGNM